MNLRVYNALRKVAASAVVETKEYDPSISGVVDVVKSAPQRIEQAIRSSYPQYFRDHMTKMDNLGDLSAVLGNLGRRGMAAHEFMNDAANKALEAENEAESKKLLDQRYNMVADFKDEADTRGFNLGSAGSYGASALGMGALGRLIAGKENAGWGWGGGILAGILANYLRRKSYYGKNIIV